MTFRTGRFERSRSRVRAFTPAHAVAALTDLDLDALHAEGKRLLLMDVDNTLVHHNADGATPEVAAWIAKAHALGFDLCIVSNTNRHDRLAAIAESLGVSVVRGRFKPSRTMFEMALLKFGRGPEETLMVGDQLMTDVLGANRAGIDAVWVQRMPGSREFVGTRVNRLAERALTRVIYKTLVASPTPHAMNDEPVLDSPAAVLDRIEHPDHTPAEHAKPGGLVGQLTKFLVVGASSFLIDFTITYLLHKKLSVGGVLVSDTAGRWLIAHFPSLFGGASEPGKASFWISVLIAATIATYNGFYWNRRWTFGVTGDEGKARQLRRVYLLGYVGMALNAAFSQLFLNIIPGHQGQSIFVAKLMAAAVVASYNFLGQRFWAFR